jgi:Ca-activated chloride channel family protein
VNPWVRGLLVGFATLFALLLGCAYPVFARGDAWLHAQFGFWWALPALAVVPLVVWKTTLGQDRRVPRLGLPTLVALVSGPRGWRSRFRDLPGVLRGAALVLGIVALARPQDVLRGENAEERGIDIVIVLDLSGSMRAVMDDAPGSQSKPIVGDDGRPKRATRLDVAKDVITDFVSRRKTDRIGVVVFGRAAFVLSPPTLDYGLLTQLVQKMDLDVIDGNGTAIGDAVGTAVARLRRSNSRSKVVILLTDGDSNAGAIDPTYATHLAEAQGVKVYTVQIGNGDNVLVQEGVDLFGQPRYTNAHFPVNPALLKQMAEGTGGEAFIATDKKALEQSMHTILDHLEKTRFEAQAATVEDLFPFLLIPGVALVALEALVRVLLIRRFP